MRTGPAPLLLLSTASKRRDGPTAAVPAAAATDDAAAAARASALPGMLLSEAAGVGCPGVGGRGVEAVGGVKMSSGLDEEGCVAAARTALLSGLHMTPQSHISPKGSVNTNGLVGQVRTTSAARCG